MDKDKFYELVKDALSGIEMKESKEDEEFIEKVVQLIKEKGLEIGGTADGESVFFCEEGLDDYSGIEPKYAKPYDELLAGKQNVVPEEYRGSKTREDILVSLSAIDRYKQEMLDNYDEVYDEDISFCDQITDDLIGYYFEESEAQAIKNIITANGLDAVEEQPDQSMQGMG